MANKKSNKSKSSNAKSWQEREAHDERRDDKRKYEDRRRKSPTNFKKKDETKNRAKEHPDYYRGNNDPSWYYPDARLALDSASLPWGEALGLPWDTIGINKFTEMVGVGSYGTDPRDLVIPGVCALEILPGVGKSTEFTSPINIAARAIFAEIRKSNSGSTNYESADYMQYLIAMSSIYSMYNWLVRLYGMTRLYNVYNRYLPQALIEVNNVDAKNLWQSLNDFRGWINTVAVRISQFNVPSVFPYFARQQWIYANVYADNAIVKAQYYEYVPACFYKYVETHETEPAYLEPVWIGRSARSTKLTFATIRSLVEDMLAAVIGSESFAIMSGDTLKAFSEGNLFQVPEISDTYAIAPVYSEEVLTQIQNAEIHALDDDHLNDTTYHIQQDPGTNPTDRDATLIIYNPKFTTTAPKSSSHLASIDAPTIGPELNLVASRFSAVVDPNYVPTLKEGSSYQFEYELGAFGSEVATAAYIIEGPWDDLQFNTGLYTDQSVYFPGGDVDYQTISSRSKLSTFNHHPIVRDWYVSVSGGQPTFTPVAQYYMVDNFTVWTYDVLRKMHQCALLGEFNISKLSSTLISN